jgi:hypothetical protein
MPYHPEKPISSRVPLGPRVKGRGMIKGMGMIKGRGSTAAGNTSMIVYCSRYQTHDRLPQ